MPTNRVLQFLRCPCCRASRQYEALKARAEAIEAEANGTIEFCIPGARRLAGELDDLDDEGPADPPTVQMFIAIDAERAPLDVDLRQYAIDEMLRIGNELIHAAERMEGAVQ